MEFENEILERFVERRADVDVAIGEGRTVVEDERLSGLRVAGADAVVNAFGVPLLEALGLALHETGFHRETRLRQIECVFVIHARQRAGR